MHPGQQAGPSINLLRELLGFSIVSTALHFTHNFVAIDQYPNNLIAGTVVQVAIVVGWPLFTAIGLLGYRLYAQGRLPQARLYLAAYSALPLATLGHFTDASPDIPAFWFATIFTDALAGIAILAFVAWSASRAAPAQRA